MTRPREVRTLRSVEPGFGYTLAGLAFVAVSMVGALLLVSDLMFDGAAVVVTGALATLGCVTCWCAAPLLRRAALHDQRSA